MSEQMPANSQATDSIPDLKELMQRAQHDRDAAWQLAEALGETDSCLDWNEVHQVWKGAWKPRAPFDTWALLSIMKNPGMYRPQIVAQAKEQLDTDRLSLPPNPRAPRGDTVFAREFDHRFLEEFYTFENPSLATYVRRDLEQSGIFPPAVVKAVVNCQPPL